LQLDVKPPGDYAADCETGEAYAIEFVKTCDCHWEFHGDAIGISESLYVFGAGVAAGYAGAVC
jgi:hypothetical protein